MLGVISNLYTEEGTARSVAQRVNASPSFGGHGPYRFNDTRTDFRFYLDNGTSYYRLVEKAVPQAISQWYLGSGGTVGFSTITGLAALDQLMTLREKGHLDFQVWPQAPLRSAWVEGASGSLISSGYSTRTYRGYESCPR